MVVSQIILWIGLHIVPFFMPTSFFLDFQWLVFILGIIFLLIQIIQFIEYVYDWNDAWIEKDGTDNVFGPWHIAILVIAFAALSLAIAMTVLMFIWCVPSMRRL